MRQVPLKCDINIAVNGQFLVCNLHQEWPFIAMLILRSKGTCLIGQCAAVLSQHKLAKFWKILTSPFSLVSAKFKQPPFLKSEFWGNPLSADII